MRPVSGRGRQFAVIARVLRVAELRRVAVGYAAFSFSEHATWLAMLVYALQRGGPREVGIVAVAQLLPGVVVAPFAAYAGDRFPAQRALAVGYAMQALAMAATAAAMLADVPIAAYIAGGVTATCITFTRPALGALLPGITHAPSDLVAANVVTGFLEQVGVFAGPLVAGGLMAWRDPWLVFVVAAVSVAIGCVSALRITTVDAPVSEPGLDASRVLQQVFAGFSTLRRLGRVRMIVWLGATAGIVKGIGDVIFVTFVDERLDGGGGASGLVAAAYGVGAIGGALGVSRLVHSGRVNRQFLLGGVLAAIPLLALAGIHALIPALAAFAVLGIGETVLQLTSQISLQREAPSAVLSRIFGILEGSLMASVAFGSMAVTLLVASTSLAAGFVILAGVVLVAVVAGVQRLRHHGDDVPVVDDALVQRLLADPVFALLPAPAVERLARSVSPVSIPAGTAVVSQGELGDRYYLIYDGMVEVTIDGRAVRDLGAGRSFGEIALLRDVPRTATVTATTDLELLAVVRDDFLEAVTGHPRSLGTATEVVEGFLGHPGGDEDDRPG